MMEEKSVTGEAMVDVLCHWGRYRADGSESSRWSHYSRFDGKNPVKRSG